MAGDADDIARLEAMIGELSLAVSGLNRARDDLQTESTVDPDAPPDLDAEEDEDDEGLRDDVTDALDEALPAVREEILRLGVEGLNFLNAYLPRTEEVQLITSIGPILSDRPRNHVLAITSRRLIAVGPGPQAAAWPLAAITGVSHHSHTFQVSVYGQPVYTATLPISEWGDDFTARLMFEVTRAVIAGE
jgi:hypothetical protein